MKIPLSLFLFVCLPVSADTIKLIDGTTYEDCKILFRQGEEIVLEYPDPQTPSIKRETRIKEYDVLKHIKSTPADYEFKKIMRKAARLGEMTPQDRTETLQAVIDFLEKNPAYPQAAQLEELADSLRDAARLPEKKPEGDAKQTAPSTDAKNPPTDSALDKERFAYDREANRLYNSIMEHARAERNVEAMQMFTMLEQFKGSAAYVKAYPEAGRLAGTLQTQWTRQRDALLKQQQERNRQMDRMSPQKQEQASKYLAKWRNEQQTVSDNLANEAKKKKWNWYTPPEDNMAATTSALYLAETVSERLARPIEQTGNRPGQLTPLIIDFWQQIDSGDLPQAKGTLKKIETAGIPPSYLEPLKNALLQQKTTPAANKELP